MHDSAIAYLILAAAIGMLGRMYYIVYFGTLRTPRTVSPPAQ